MLQQQKQLTKKNSKKSNKKFTWQVCRSAFHRLYIIYILYGTREPNQRLNHFSSAAVDPDEKMPIDFDFRKL